MNGNVPPPVIRTYTRASPGLIIAARNRPRSPPHSGASVEKLSSRRPGVALAALGTGAGIDGGAEPAAKVSGRAAACMGTEVATRGIGRVGALVSEQQREAQRRDRSAKEMHPPSFRAGTVTDSRAGQENVEAGRRERPQLLGVDALERHGHIPRAGGFDAFRISVIPDGACSREMIDASRGGNAGGQPRRPAGEFIPKRRPTRVSRSRRRSPLPRRTGPPTDSRAGECRTEGFERKRTWTPHRRHRRFEYLSTRGEHAPQREETTLSGLRTRDFDDAPLPVHHQGAIKEHVGSAARHGNHGVVRATDQATLEAKPRGTLRTCRLNQRERPGMVVDDRDRAVPKGELASAREKEGILVRRE